MATREFKKDEFICEYSGELISQKQGLVRELEYQAEVGSFLSFFNFKEKHWW